MPTFNFPATDPVSIYPPRGTSNDANFVRFEPLITPDVIKTDYLFGIPLKSSLTNETLSDGTITRFITAAVSHIEHLINIPISPVDFVERFDYSHRDFQKFTYIKLNHWPVTTLKAIRAKYPASPDFVDYNTSWISCYNETGIFQLVPATGPQAQVIYQGNSLFLPFLLGSSIKWPQLWEVTYTAGFDSTPNGQGVPAVINQLIGAHVAMKCLSLLGPVLYPLNSYSIGIDGVSQATGNAGTQFFALRMQELLQLWNDSLAAVKRQYAQTPLLSSLGD